MLGEGSSVVAPTDSSAVLDGLVVSYGVVCVQALTRSIVGKTFFICTVVERLRAAVHVQHCTASRGGMGRAISREWRAAGARREVAAFAWHGNVFSDPRAGGDGPAPTVFQGHGAPCCGGRRRREVVDPRGAFLNPQGFGKTAGKDLLPVLPSRDVKRLAEELQATNRSAAVCHDGDGRAGGALHPASCLKRWILYYRTLIKYM
jgi:hypothetical protein